VITDSRWTWLFLALNRRPYRWIIPTAFYYWLLDHLTDNNGWRPLTMRHPEWFGGKRS